MAKKQATCCSKSVHRASLWLQVEAENKESMGQNTQRQFGRQNIEVTSHWDLQPPQLQVFVLDFEPDINTPLGRWPEIQLVLLTIAEPLLHKQEHPAWHVSILACRVDSQAGMSVTVPTSSLHGPSDMMKARQHAGSSQFSPSSISPRPTINACTCSVCSNSYCLALASNQQQ